MWSRVCGSRWKQVEAVNHFQKFTPGLTKMKQLLELKFVILCIPFPRHNDYEGPSQYIPVVQGHSYAVRGWIKLLNDEGQGQPVRLEVDFKFSGK